MMKTKKKLVLTKETLARLDEADLIRAVGLYGSSLTACIYCDNTTVCPGKPPKPPAALVSG